MAGNRFDELSKALAQGSARRTFLKVLAALPLGGLLSSLLPREQAQAGVAPPGQITLDEAYQFCNREYGSDHGPEFVVPWTINGRPATGPVGLAPLKICLDEATVGTGPAYGTCGPVVYQGVNCEVALCGAPMDPTCACVTTVDRGVTCVKPICTHRPCNRSLDCAPESVCFTQGCCGGSSKAGFCVPRCFPIVIDVTSIGTTSSAGPGAPLDWQDE